MMYALLQERLDQTISRQAMEEASVAAPAVARADCARLQRELFGIVVRKLEMPDALKFQAALRMRGFPTELVEDAKLLELMPAQRGQALRLEPDAVVLVDTMYQREQRFPREWIVFAAGGFLKDLKRQPHRKMEWDIRPGPQGSVQRNVVMATEYEYEKTPAFRLELFLAREPFRLRWALDEQNLIRINNQPVRLRDRARLLELLKSPAGYMAADRVNQGIRWAVAGVEWVYPSESAFEEEIIWSFYQLKRRMAG